MYWGGVVSLLLLGTSVYASTIIQATSINYVDTDNLGATNVQDALDKISTKATKKIEEAKKECPIGAECTYKTICKRATTLHTEECQHTDTNNFCSGAGYTIDGSKKTTTITYGSLGTKGTLTSGDAFDCDVNGDGVYNEATERFYYLTDLDNNSSYAVLFYYTDVGTSAYDESGSNLNGPVTAKTKLPTIEQWKNVSLAFPIRAITTDNGANTVNGTELPTDFSYSGYAARMLSINEVARACGVSSYTELWEDQSMSTKCTYLLEDTDFSSSKGKVTYWLENPTSDFGVVREIWINVGRPSVSRANTAEYIRPVIEVAKTNISY